MTNPQLGASLARNADGSVSVEAAREDLMKAGAALVEKAVELAMTENVAALYRDGPLEAGVPVRDAVFSVAGGFLTDAFTALDDHGKAVEVKGQTYRMAEPTPGRAMTIFGPVDFRRSRYRPSGLGRP